MTKYEEALDLIEYYYKKSRKYKKLQKYNCEEYFNILKELVKNTVKEEQEND